MLVRFERLRKITAALRLNIFRKTYSHNVFKNQAHDITNKTN